jgi:hypothetical protein
VAPNGFWFWAAWIFLFLWRAMGWMGAVSALLAPHNKVVGSKVQQAD